MLGESGLFALVLIALLSSLSFARYGWCHFQAKSSDFSLTSISRLNAALAVFSLAVLAGLFLGDQFQFAYVAAHSNSALPPFFKFAAVWGGHEGSMLFWVFTLCLWTGLISLHSLHQSRYFQNVLWVMSGFVAAFAWFTLLASNPFAYSELFVSEGRDLNPMLQDIGLIFHPPLLYLGYIGFSTVLAFALAALLEKEYNHRWVEYCRTWVISAWMLLTLGILIGSWWAYNELGWGGWWFWDPVENASLLPWLTGSALLHSLVASARHQQLKLWSLSLALVTFCLSILGTFIVRSGVLTSVHAFAVDPTKGVALLAILAVTLLCSFILLFKHADGIKSARFTAIVSRGYAIFLATGLFGVATFTVFLGTFYPMIYELIGLGAISVGAPYFNTLMLPLTIGALLLMGSVPYLKWRKGSVVSPRVFLFALLVFLSAGIGCYLWQVEDWQLVVALVWGGAAWVVGSHLHLVWRYRRFSFMALAHIGIAILCVGAVMNGYHSYELNRKMAPETSVNIDNFRAEYQETLWYVGPNYTAEQASIRFHFDDGQTFVVKPERRHYQVRVMNMSEPAIYSTWHGDYYVTLGAKVDSQSYAVKIQYRAYILWIWFGALLTIFGAVLPLLKQASLLTTRTTHGAIQES
ncbi:heme lyase CcmF/NrfE family subunit [Vibrio japonicus]|uniref:Heme lyase CcmF/NrfE family subunit n=1 Tax=Vibrio japonicus TaxID=1824638 RepID=A0ABY5LCT1_9VIBR|nr:heme lyase CcmF/NrfE family subunit [Vibrio japonicus]UUM29859.1 heme lyase CcmF/NrfE family subunit [Vibrio japonicus]